MPGRAAAGGALAGALLSVIVTIAACNGHTPAAAPDLGTLSTEPCVGIPNASARCYRLGGSENQTTRRGRTISLRIVVIPATGQQKAKDAVVYLAGGPGQAATELMGDGFDIEGVREHRDLVYADQRGTRGSHPLLCQFYGPPENPQ